MKRFLRFVSGDIPRNKVINSPDDIPRLYAHFGPWKNVKRVSLTKSDTVAELNTSGYRFMVARDPYSRLWSGYLDKLYLPDFWGLFGRGMIKKVRPNADERSLKCGHNLTFEEFLNYVATNLETQKFVDMHFKPSYLRCNPCLLRFNMIAKTETLSEDFEQILRDNNLTGLFSHSAENKDRGLEEIKTLTEYNFDGQKRWVKKDNADCYVQTEIAKRIWTTFQLNGYIGDSYVYPETEVKKITTQEGVRDYLLEKLTSIRKLATEKMKTEWKGQRLKYLTRAYHEVPLSIKRRIRDAYRIDLELFKYELEPSYVF